MSGVAGLRKIQIGAETTAGTAVAADVIWRSEAAGLSDDRVVSFVPEQVGVALPADRSYTAKLAGSIDFPATPATFEHLPHILCAGIKSVRTGAADGSGSTKIYAYPLGTTSVNSIDTYSIQSGDNQQAELMDYGFVESFTLSGSAGEAVMVSAKWQGRQVADGSFTGALSVVDVEEILTGKGTFFIDAIGGTAGSTAVTTTLLDWSLDVTTGWKPLYTVDSGQLYFDKAIFDADAVSAELKVTYEHNSSAVTQRTAFRAETPQLFQLFITGSAATTAGTAYSNNTLKIDLTGKYSEFDAVGSSDGSSTVAATIKGGYDATPANMFGITVVNEVTALA